MSLFRRRMAYHSVYPGLASICGWSILCRRMLPTVMLSVSFLLVSTEVMSALNQMGTEIKKKTQEWVVNWESIQHTLSHRHFDAVAAWSDYLHNQQSQTSITSTLSQACTDQILQNRHYLKTILEVLMYCAVYEIVLRGHKESVDLRNKGNFLLGSSWHD